MPLKVLVQIYYTLIYPHLTYCITVWGGSYRSILKPVNVLQNRILRAIYGAEFNASACPIYQHLKLMNLEQIFLYMVGAYVFKALNSDLPCMFEYREQTNYTTRESALNLLKIPRVLSAQSEHSIRFSGPKTYNMIPGSIRDCSSYQSFKLNYKHHLRSGNT